MTLPEPPVIAWSEGEADYVIVFDAITSDTSEVTATLTTHPVEAGADVSDHKRPGPRRLTLEAIVSNSPLGDVPESGLGPSDVRLLSDGTYTAPFDRVRDVAESLRYLVESDILVSVSTAVADYDALSLVAVSSPKTDATDSVRFTIDAEEVRIVETRTVAASALPREDRGRQRTQNGAANAESAETGASDRRSILAAGLDSVQESANDPEASAALRGLAAAIGASR